MSSMLEVRDSRRSRSKSPGGRDRDRSRSHSRDARGDPDPRDRDRDRDRERSSDRRERDRSSDRRRSSKYSGSDHDDGENGQRYKDQRSSKNSYYAEEEDDRRKKEKSSRAYEEHSEDDRYRSSKSAKDSRRRDRSASDDDNDRRRGGSKRDNNKKRSDSDSDRRKSSRKHRDDSDSSGSENDRRKSSNGRTQQSAYGYAPPPAPAPPGAYSGSRPQDARNMNYTGNDPRYAPPGTFPTSSAPTATQRTPSFGGNGAPEYAKVDQYKYAQPDANINYKYKDSTSASYSTSGQPYSSDRRAEYERARPSESDRRKERKNTDERYETREPREKKYHDDDKDQRRNSRYNDDKYGNSTENVTKKLSKMAMAGGLGAATLGVASQFSGDGGKPPASPLLEAYKGTYQSISPMPTALVLANHRDDSDLSDLDIGRDDSDDDLKRKIRKLEREKAEYESSRGKDRDRARGEDKYETREPRSSGGLETREPRSRRLSNLDTSLEVREPGGTRDRSRDRWPASDVFSPTTPSGKKKVSFYDPTSDALRIAKALQGTGPADPRPLLQILPDLTTDELFALRAEYKNQAKVSGQGINIAKHIKMRVPGNLGKACYATALGRWESEAYWANSWYQGGASRRELLIESLMGRSNHDIKEIKNCFKDKKYGDDLERCVRTELKADKFRMAILLALEERRMPESTPLDIRLVKSDVGDLYHALNSQGGESDMLKIIVLRSDTHLREVLRLFEGTYGIHFARAMISKSRNLVGETLAHILNGALNRPMRDALLLHQAISETAPGKERTELLISRLVRLHWEPKHLERVKHVYEERYRISVREAIKREVLPGMKTPEGKMCVDFCIELVDSA